ncbi:eukaryotic translation initiation factor 3 subunit E, partial [Podila humilis]
MSAQYDLTSKMIPFLDIHLVFPLLEFLEINELSWTHTDRSLVLELSQDIIAFLLTKRRLSLEIERKTQLTWSQLELGWLGSLLYYSPASLLNARYELSLKTNMIDFIEKLNGDLKDAGEVPAAVELKREDILEKLQASQAEAQKVMDVIENPDVIAALRQDKLQNLQFLKDNYGMTPEMIQTLYKFGQFQYSCGNYGGAADMLYHYRVLSTDDTLGLSALWGKLASEILVGNWEVAYEAIQELKENIDKT